MLRRHRKDTGVGVSELVRRLVDEYFKDKPQFWDPFVIPVPRELIEEDTKDATFKVDPSALRLRE